MGSGVWTTSAFTAYSKATGKRILDNGTLSDSHSAQDLFKSNYIQPELNPLNVVRECRDSEDHPNTIPVILALDVTGSMGSAAAEVAKKLNVIMTQLYENVEDVEFCVMGIGDLAYDSAPIQISQFEADVRIAEWLDKIYFEGGGGGNGFESYTGAWYMGLRHTDLDCWKRGKKGIIITMGDEELNPYLPASALSAVTGDGVEGNIETKDLYKAAIEKFDLYHLAVNDTATSYKFYKDRINSSFGKYFDDDHFMTVNLDNIVAAIVGIVSGAKERPVSEYNSGISW